MNCLKICLAISGPLIGIIYTTLKYFGIIAKWTKLIYAEEALVRLESAAGFPKSCIFNDSIDQKHFNEIFKIIKKKTKQEKIIKTLKEGHIPSMLTIGGMPTSVKGVPETWSQEERNSYSDSHPIILTFNVQRNSDSKGKGDIVCTLGELKLWLKKENEKYDYILGAIVIGVIVIAFALWELKLS